METSLCKVPLAGGRTSRLLLCLALAAALGCADKAANTGIEPVDADQDGYASVATGGEDCDDDNAAVHPGVQEECDGIDNDCDGHVDLEDPDLTDVETWYVDNDGDGYGTPDYVSDGCEQPDGTSTNAEDCDDHDDDIHPGASEYCDGEDNDCDGAIDDEDDDVLGADTWYVDADGDGYGDTDSAEKFCEDPEDGRIIEGGDCDDGDTGVNPDAKDVCDDGVDTNCDGEDC